MSGEVQQIEIGTKMALSQLIDRLPAVPPDGAGEFGETETVPLSKRQKLTSAFLHRNWLAVPHVTHHDDADITLLEERRRAFNAAHPSTRLTVPVLVARVLVDALRAFPTFNASLDQSGENLVLKKFFNIGFALDTGSGLLVGVIKQCDDRTASAISSELGALAEKAKGRGLSMSEMSGGSMTISSLGHIGGTAFTPIINVPEVAIIGLSRAKQAPALVDDGQIEWRTLLPLSLSYDHRVINGADAARFTRFVADGLQRADIVA